MICFKMQKFCDTFKQLRPQKIEENVLFPVQILTCEMKSAFLKDFSLHLLLQDFEIL